MFSVLTIIDIGSFGLVLFSAFRRIASKPRTVEALFIDCDDCIYQNNWKTAEKITQSISAYTAQMGVSREKAYELYKTHGTCLKGLLVEGLVDEEGAETFLRTVHTIDYTDIEADPRLQSELAGLRVPHWIFTASAAEHAQRCMERVGIATLPWRGIIDTRSCKFESKYAQSSFQAAMEAANVSDASACVFCDDSIKNIKAAKAAGWRTVLVGMIDRDSGSKIDTPSEADAHIASLHELRSVMPELF